MFFEVMKKLAGSGQLPQLIVATLLINLLGLGISVYSTNVLNRYVSVGITVTLVTLTVGVFLAIGFEVLLRKQRQVILDEIGDGMDDAASGRVFDAFARSGYAQLTGIALPVRREALAAPPAQQQLFSHSNLATVLDLPFVLLYLLALTLLYWPLGILGGVVCALALLLGVLGERKSREPAEAHAKASSRAQQMGQFLLAAGETIRGLPMLGPLTRRWSQVQSASLRSRRGSMLLQAELQSRVQTLGQVLTVLIYAIGAMAAVKGAITTGALIGASILAGRAFATCSRAAYLADPWLRAKRAQAALAQLEADGAADGGRAEPPQFKGQLELHDLAFAYPRLPTPLFERVNLVLGAGQVLLIKGPNGAGKSTLIKVLLGVLTPTRGMVRADGIELRQIAAAWWHAHAGYAPQEALFFDGTLRENLLLDRPVEDAELIQWIRELGLDGFLASDPQGLDRQITSHDTTLAMGLRRRFVLIRALLGRPPVVFLDDPTEGLDQAGLLAVAGVLNRLATRGCTLVIASNDPFIQRAADLTLDLGVKPVPQLLQKTPAGGDAPACED